MLDGSIYIVLGILLLLLVLIIVLLLKDRAMRRKIEAELRESDERFHLAAQAGRMFAYEWDVTTDLVVRSGESVQILGIDESRPTTAQELITMIEPGDRKRVTAAIAALSPEKSYLHISYRRVRPDGTVIWVERIGRAYFDEQGRMVRMVGMTADISERKRAEREVGLANDRLRLAMESGKTVGWDRDVKSGRDSLFGDLQSMFGIPSEVFDGRVEDFHRYLHPEDCGKVLHAIDDAMHAQKPYAAEFRILRPDGNLRWIAAKGKFYYSPDGEPERMLGMAVDITERKQVEEALREGEERLRLAIRAGKMYAFDWDAATDVIIRSEEVAHISGLIGEPIRLNKQQFLTSVHSEDRAIFNTSIAELTPESPNSQISFRLLRPDGSVRWLQRTGHAFFDKQGRIVRMIGMVGDVTERKLAEGALSAVSGRLIEAQEAERRRIARELHDDVSQKLVMLTVELQELANLSFESNPQLRNRIESLLKRTLEMSEDVHSLSHRLHSSKLELLGLVGTMRGFCQELAEQRDVEIDFRHSDVPNFLPAQISLCLFRILQEGLGNAVKHSGVRHFESWLERVANELQLTIRDSGGGFDPSTAMNNQGIGLISMRERVNLVKGTISIVSKPGGGTQIQVRVPIAVQTGADQKSASA
jgi:PAS domain S-box-containing protein